MDGSNKHDVKRAPLSAEERKKRELAYIRGWAQTGRELEAIRRRELHEFDFEARAWIVNDLLEAGLDLSLPRPMTGLVEQQRLFKIIREKMEAKAKE